MPWTEEQKRNGLVELHRRRTTETPNSRRTTFFKALFAATGAFILSLLLLWSTVHSSTARIRVESALLALITSTLLLFASVLAYVPFLDWHRGTKSDGVSVTAGSLESSWGWIPGDVATSRYLPGV